METDLNALQLVRFPYLDEGIRENGKMEMWPEPSYITLVIQAGGQEDGVIEMFLVSYCFQMEFWMTQHTVENLSRSVDQKTVN